MPSPETFALSLFPLQTVLFPEGLLSLKVFEARYLDLVGSCLREGKPFGVVALKQGSEVRQGTDKVAFEKLGTLAELIDVDSPQPGILHVRCRGGQRFDVKTSSQQPDGLWVAEAAHVPEDEICFFVFDAPSSGDAALAAQLAELRPLRIVEAISSGKE